MPEATIHRRNHSVPRVYLRRWASSHERIWEYRVLVSHERVPIWKRCSIRGVACYDHLYTRMAAGRETDDVERWLDREFEAPAEEAIHKATSGAHLTAADWRSLVRFAAAQDVRTPARLVENLKRWRSTFPELVQTTLEESVRKLKEARQCGVPISRTPFPNTEYVPIRVTTAVEPEHDGGQLTVEAVVGRGLWLFGIRHLLTRTVNALHQHRWTILSPPEDLRWFTSDDPVVRLNYYRPGHYDFKGGWGNPGTEIFLPLGPRHLLYTKVSKRPPPRGTVLRRSHAVEIRRFIAEHAHRMIFSSEPDLQVPILRQRAVDANAYRSENEQWRNWHKEQTDAERRLMGWDEQT